MKRIILILILHCLVLSLAAQKNTDSLKAIVKLNKADAPEVDALLSLVNVYKFNDPGLSLKWALQALNLSEKIKYKTGKATALVYYGNLIQDETDGTLADTNFLKAISLFTELKDKRGLAWVYVSIGDLYTYKGNYEKALSYLLMNIELNDELKNETGKAWGSDKIGHVYLQLSQFKNAEKYFQISGQLFEKTNDEQGMASNYTSLGILNDYLKNYELSCEYYDKAIKIYKRTGDKVHIVTTLSNIGIVYLYQGKYSFALKSLEESNKLAHEINLNSTIASNFINIGEIFVALGQNAKAISSLEQGISLAKKLNLIEYEQEGYRILSEAYKNSNDLHNALHAKDIYYSIKDSLLNEATHKHVTEMGTKYETEKKDQQNKLLLTENRLSAESIKKQKLITYFIIAGLFLALGLAYFIFNGLREQKKANNIISLQKEDIQKQKEIVEEHQKEIVDSINYAQRIQRSLLASNGLLNANLYSADEERDYFVFFQPKDIVSGDFYWAASSQDAGLFFLVTADSTGHGVPGAIMSMLNISCLNEAVKGQKLTGTSEILDYTRAQIIQHLANDGSAEGGKDGMDCSLVAFDFKNKRLTYSAANNPVWIIRNTMEAVSPELIELAPDKMPVGKHDKDGISFTQTTVGLQRGDMVYTFTDGMPDQFGGPKGKKFMYKQLKELLISSSRFPLPEQKEIISNSLSKWIGPLEQVDDICLIGVRI